MVAFEALDHAKFMREALKEAELALKQDERPIGAVIEYSQAELDLMVGFHK